MGAQYNPAEIERLVRDAREFLAILAKPLTDKSSATYAAERLGPVNKMIDRYAAMADQLEAARAEIDRMRPVVSAAVALRETAGVDRLGSTATWVRALLDFEAAADVYRASKP